MRKIALLTIALTLIAMGAKAQGVSTYVMSTDSAPWASIASTGTQLTSVVGDFGTQTLAMPFDFDFGETHIAQGSNIRVRSDGHVVMSNATGLNQGYNYCNGNTPAIIPLLMEDGQMPQGSSACYWQTETTADGQVLVIEFQHVQHYNGNQDDFNYQIRLYENGNVAVHYGHLENHYSFNNFNCLMVATPLNGYGDAIALMGSWDNPVAFHPSSIPHGANAVGSFYMTGLPDSGMVVTYERPEPPCPRPRNLRIADLTSTAVTLMWTGNDVSGGTYRIEYDTTWISPLYLGQSVEATTNDTVLFLDTLLPNHHYYVYVMSHCGNDSSSWQSLDFWTPCAPISHAALPLTEDFQSYSNSNSAAIFNPGCWRFVGSSAYVAYQNTATAANRRLRILNGMVMLPPFDSVADLEISFSYYLDNFYNDNGVEIALGVLDEAGDTSSFVPLYVLSGTGSWASRTLRLGGYADMGNTIAFRVKGLCYVDDVDVHLALGCPEVQSVTVASIDSTSAVVTWFDPNAVGSYRVVYAPIGTTSMTDSVDVTATSATLTGLLPNTDHVATVYSLCGNQRSQGQNVILHTICSPMTVPFFEGFEGTAMPTCWTVETLRLWNSSSSPVQPALSDTLVASGQRSLQMASYRPSNSKDVAWVVLPEMVPPVNRLQIEFDYCVPLWWQNVELAVGITATEGDTSGFTRMCTFRPVDSLWHHYSFDFALANGSGRIALMQINHTSRGYWASRPADFGFLDNVSVSALSPCGRPAAVNVGPIGPTTALVSWVETDSVGSYQVSCNGNSYTVTGSTSFLLTSLTPQTTYTVEVRRLCSGTLTDARSATFSTECAGVTVVPWSENFNSWPQNSFDNCWTRHQGSDSYSSVTVFDIMDIHCLRMTAEIWQGENNRTLLVLPPVALSYTALSISMNVMGFNSSSNNSLLELGVLADATDSSTFTVFDTVPFTDCGLSNWEYYEHALDGIGNGRLALRFTSLSSWHQVYIDNVSLFYVTSCGYPDQLVVDSVSQTSLGVSVSDPDSVGHYRLWWNNGVVVDSADIIGFSHNITGLHHSTRYTVSAATICPSDTSLSTLTSIEAATDCGIITHNELPYEENYDNGIGLCSSFLDYCTPGNSGDRTHAGQHRGPAGKSLHPSVNSNVPFFYVLPEVDSLGGLALEFWLYTVYGTNHDMVTVGVMGDPADTTTFIAIQTVYPLVAEQWELHHVSLGTYSGPGRHVALRFGSYGGLWWGQYMDDLSLLPDLLCQAPNSLTVASVTDTSATLVVHDPGQVGHYRLYAPTDTIDFYGDTVILGGLNVATDYTVRVRSVCTDGNTTFPVQVSFTTDCGIFPLPYIENFDNQQLYTMPRCWMLKDSATYQPSVRPTPHGEGQCLSGSLRSPDSLVRFSTPTFHVADTDIYISFRIRVTQYYSDTNYHAHYMPMRLELSYLGDTMDNLLYIFDDTISSDESFMDYVWQTININTLDIPRGEGTLYFTFYRDSTATSATFAIDSLSIQAVHYDPPCQRVAALHVDNVTLASATVGWTPRGPATAWQLHLFGPTVDTVMDLDTNHVLLTGLVQASEHFVVVRPLCDEGQMLWSDTVTFTTLQCPEVENVVVTVTSAHTVEVAWQAPTAGPWVVEYGQSGFDQGFGLSDTVPTQDAGRVTYQVAGLTANTPYDLYVMTLCDEDKASIWSEPVHFTTDLDGIDNNIEIRNSEFSISPNPAHGRVTLQGLVHGATVTVRDASGRLVKKFVVQDSTFKTVLDLPTGVYFVTATTLSATMTRKLIVK